MSAITIESDLVHYEVLGRGRPVIFVHGWLGSWRYWVNTMQYLSSKYRTYALDLWGFGDSGKDEKKYSLQSQVMLLFQFFERLGIPKAALVGHSLGAAVCLSFARQFPDRAYRMMLISPPLYDAGGLDETRPEAMIGLSGGMNTTSTQTVGMSGTVTGTGITPAVPAAPPVTSTPFPPSVVTSAAPAAPSPSVGGAISGETQPAAPIAPTTPSSSSSVSGNVPPVSAAPPTSTPAGLPPLPALREQPGTVTPANAPTYSSSSETLPRNP
ncbi:MAG TPA: alpha/beta fold hydrolase, partial [Aggregatilineales bacterium]|nr:alpha/beta fold hydrolase [Aggregatilineales bacterium]